MPRKQQIRRPKTPPTALILRAATAADLMSPNPVSISERASVREAVTLLTDEGFSGLPVVNEHGRPVGVVSRADIVEYDREQQPHPVGERLDGPPLRMIPGTAGVRGYHVEEDDSPRVGAIMSPVLYSVRPDTPPMVVIQEMARRNVHRIFVTAEDGRLLGIISALDVITRLEAPA